MIEGVGLSTNKRNAQQLINCRAFYKFTERVARLIKRADLPNKPNSYIITCDCLN